MPTAAIALEVTPVAREYGIALTADPVLIAGDSYGPLHDALGASSPAPRAAAGLTHAARRGLELRLRCIARCCAPATVARTACLAFATENTHGFEIAHLDGIANCVTVLERLAAAGAWRAAGSARMGRPRRSSSAG